MNKTATTFLAKIFVNHVLDAKCNFHKTGIGVHLNNLKIDIIKIDPKTASNCLFKKKNLKSLEPYMALIEPNMALVGTKYGSIEPNMALIEPNMALTFLTFKGGEWPKLTLTLLILPSGR